MPWMTIPIAMAITGGGAAAAQIYGQKSANKTNKRSIEASERSETRAMELDRQRLAEERRALDARIAEERAAREATLAEQRAEREAKLARDRERWQDYIRVNEPIWRAGSGVLSSLYDIAGYGRENAPAFQMPSQSASGTVPLASAGPPPVGMPRNDFPTRDGSPVTIAGNPAGASALATRRAARRPIVAPRAPQAINLADLMAMASSGGGADAIGRSIGS